MPYKVEQDGDKFCVVKEGGEQMKCYDAESDAQDYLKALNAAEDDKSFSMLQQAGVSYVTVSATPGQACANCRWFQSFGDQWTQHPRCHLVTDYPEAIEPTGRCDRWEEGTFNPAQMTPMPVVIVEPETMESEAAVGKQQRTLMERLLDLLPKRKQAADATGFKVVGNHWLITWSNNFEDRDGEIFTAKAIDKYVARVDMGAVPPPELWVWHTPGTRIGQAAWVGRHEHFVMAAGTFDETPQAQAAKAYYQRNAPKTGVSHGFAFPTDKFDGKHYHDFNTFEITLLPRDAEANRFTSLEGVKSMALDEKKRAYLEAAFGKEQAEKILADQEARGKALEEVGVAYKDFVEATDAAPDSAAKEAVDNVEVSIKALIADMIGDSAEDAQQRATAAKAFTALVERVQQLEVTTAALKEIVDLKPRSASADEDTLITNEKLTADVKQQFARIDPFWGTEVTDTP